MTRRRYTPLELSALGLSAVGQRAVADHVSDLYRQIDVLSKTRVAASPESETRPGTMGRGARAGALAALGLHTMKAWHCPKCRCFNGEERALIPNCRRCDCPRPISTETAASAQE